MSGMLSVDGATFVLDGVVLTGPCTRLVHDVGSGESRELEMAANEPAS